MRCIKQGNGRPRSKQPFTPCRQSSATWSGRLVHESEFFSLWVGNCINAYPREFTCQAPDQAHTLRLKTGKYTENDVKQQEDLKSGALAPRRNHIISQMHALSTELYEAQRIIHEAEGATVLGGGASSAAPAVFWQKQTGYGLADAALTPRSGASTATPRGNSPTITPRGLDAQQRQRSSSPTTGDRSARHREPPHHHHHHGVHANRVQGLQEASRDDDLRHLHAATHLNHDVAMAKKFAGKYE